MKHDVEGMTAPIEEHLRIDVTCSVTRSISKWQAYVARSLVKVADVAFYKSPQPDLVGASGHRTGTSWRYVGSSSLRATCFGVHVVKIVSICDIWHMRLDRAL